MNAKILKKKTLAAIGLTVAGFGAAGSAQATAIAFAENRLTNFAITSSPGSNISVTGTPQRNTSNFATFTGFPGAVFQDPVPLGNASDALEAFSGTGPIPGQNNYVFLAGTGGGMVGSRGDSDTSAGNPFAPGGVPQVNNVAEARVTTGAGKAGSSGGMNTANAAIAFSFVLAGPGTITFNFSDVYRYYASTTTNGEGAQGTIANIFTINDAAGNTVFNDSQAVLNVNCASNSGVPSVCDSGLLNGTFSDTSGLLSAGNYTISLLTSSAATVTSLAAVPEPATLLLLGGGVGAMAFVRRRSAAHC